MFAVDFAEDNIYKTFTVSGRCHGILLGISVIQILSFIWTSKPFSFFRDSFL